MGRLDPVRIVLRAAADDGADTQGHSTEDGLDVARLRMETADGNEVVAEAEGDHFKIVEGPDDVIGHVMLPVAKAPGVVARVAAAGGRAELLTVRQRDVGRPRGAAHFVLWAAP